MLIHFLFGGCASIHEKIENSVKTNTETGAQMTPIITQLIALETTSSVAINITKLGSTPVVNVVV